MVHVNITGNITADPEYDHDLFELLYRFKTVYRVSLAFIVVTTVVGVLANVLVLYMILRDQKLRNTVYNIYVVSLCLSSTLFLVWWGLSDVVIYGTYLNKGHYLLSNDNAFVKILAGFDTSTMVINCLMVMALAIDRYVIVAYPVRRRSWRTVKNAIYGCAVVWAFGIVASCVAIPVDAFTPMSVLYAIDLSTVILIYVIPVIVIAVCFGLTLRAAAARRNSPTITPAARRGLARRLRFLTVVCSVSLSFIVCWGYWYGFYLVRWSIFFRDNFYRSKFVLRFALDMFARVVVMLNAALNPFLYVLTRPTILRQLVALIKCGPRSTPAEDADPEEDTQSELNAMPGDDHGMTLLVKDETVKEEFQ